MDPQPASLLARLVAASEAASPAAEGPATARVDVRAWEDTNLAPDRATSVFLRVIDAEPEVVTRALGEARRLRQNVMSAD